MKTIAIAGAGAIGSAVCQALIDGIDGFSLVAASSLDPCRSKELIGRPAFDLPFVSLNDLTARADWIVEALPVAAVPALARNVMKNGKTLVMISSAALLLHPELKSMAGKKGGRIIVPSGAIAGLDGINALAEQGIESARLVTTKPPQAYADAPYVVKKEINLKKIRETSTIFSGNALQAAAAFPANINVAATLTLATRLDPENVHVEIHADPGISANRHEITVEGEFSTMKFLLENRPDPTNPKSSALAARSIIATLRRQQAPLWIG